MLTYYSLTDDFNSFLQNIDTEFEDGKNTRRPHIYIPLIIDGVNILLPFRSSVNHRHKFEVTEGRKGYIDYTKAIVIDLSNLNSRTIPYPKNMNQQSHIFIQKNEQKIKSGFIRYLNAYKRALKTKDKNNGSNIIVQYSTLKNFHIELKIEEP